MRAARRIARWVVAACLLCWLSYVVVYSAPTFQKCISETEDAEHPQQIDKDPQLFYRHVVAYTRIDFVCTAHWAHEFEGALTMFATLVIAMFTFTLWRATDKLWEEAKEAGRIAAIGANAAAASVDLARVAFAAAHRPRMRIRHVQLGAWIEADKPIKLKIVAVNNGDSDAQIIEFDAVAHLVPKGRHVPQEPFAGRQPYCPMMPLTSGVAVEYQAQSDAITIGDISKLNAREKHLYCFAYIDYIDTAERPNIRKTACCRMLALDENVGARSVLKGTFMPIPSDHEYED